MGIKSNSPGAIKITSSDEEIVEIDGTTADPIRIGVVTVDVQQDATDDYEGGSTTFQINVLEDPDDPDTDGDGEPDSIDDDDDGDGVLDVDEKPVSISVTPSSLVFDFNQYEDSVAETFLVTVGGTNPTKGFTFTFPEGYDGSVDGVAKSSGDEITITDNDGHLLKIHPAAKRTVRYDSDVSTITFTTRDSDSSGNKLTATMTVQQTGDPDAVIENLAGSGNFSWDDNSDISLGSTDNLTDSNFAFTWNDAVNGEYITIAITTNIDNPSENYYDAVTLWKQKGWLNTTQVDRIGIIGQKFIKNQGTNWGRINTFTTTPTTGTLKIDDTDYSSKDPREYYVIAHKYGEAPYPKQVLDAIKVTRKPTKGLQIKDENSKFVIDDQTISLETITPATTSFTVESISPSNPGWEVEKESEWKNSATSSTQLLMRDGTGVTYGSNNTPLTVDKILCELRYKNPASVYVPYGAIDAFYSWANELFQNGEATSTHPIVFIKKDGTVATLHSPYYGIGRYKRTLKKSYTSATYANHSSNSFVSYDINNPSDFEYQGHNFRISTSTFYLGQGGPYTGEQPTYQELADLSGGIPRSYAGFVNKIIYGSQESSQIIINPSTVSVNTDGGTATTATWAASNPVIGEERSVKATFKLKHDPTIKTTIKFTQEPSIQIRNLFWTSSDKTTEYSPSNTIPNTPDSNGNPSGTTSIFLDTNVEYKIKIIGPFSTTAELTGGEIGKDTFIEIPIKPKYFNFSDTAATGKIIVTAKTNNSEIIKEVDLSIAAFSDEVIQVEDTANTYTVPEFDAVNASNVTLDLDTTYAYWEIDEYELNGFTITTTDNDQSGGTITVSAPDAGIEGRTGSFKIISGFGEEYGEYIVNLTQEKLVREYTVNGADVDDGTIELDIDADGGETTITVGGNDTYHGLTWEATIPDFVTAESLTGDVNTDDLVVTFPDNSRPGGDELNGTIVLKYFDEFGKEVHSVDITHSQQPVPRTFSFNNIEVVDGETINLDITSAGLSNSTIAPSSNDELIYYEIEEVTDPNNNVTLSGNTSGRVDVSGLISIGRRYGSESGGTSSLRVKFKDQGEDGDQYAQITVNYVQPDGPTPSYTLLRNNNDVNNEVIRFGSTRTSDEDGIIENAALNSTADEVNEVEVDYIVKTNVRDAKLNASSTFLRFYDVANDDVVRGTTLSSIPINQNETNGEFTLSFSIWAPENSGYFRDGTTSFSIIKDNVTQATKTLNTEQFGTATSVIGTYGPIVLMPDVNSKVVTLSDNTFDSDYLIASGQTFSGIGSAVTTTVSRSTSSPVSITNSIDSVTGSITVEPVPDLAPASMGSTTGVFHEVDFGGSGSGRYKAYATLNIPQWDADIGNYNGNPSNAVIEYAPPHTLYYQIKNPNSSGVTAAWLEDGRDSTLEIFVGTREWNENPLQTYSSVVFGGNARYTTPGLNGISWSRGFNSGWQAIYTIGGPAGSFDVLFESGSPFPDTISGDIWIYVATTEATYNGVNLNRDQIQWAVTNATVNYSFSKGN